MELSPPHETLQMWKLTLAYDGTDFHGWQVQPGLITIQGELRAAIARVTGEEVLSALIEHLLNDPKLSAQITRSIHDRR